MHRIIVIAIPVFALFIAFEFVYGVLKGRNTYRLNDAISSLSQGLLSQVVAVCTQLFQIGLYTLIFPYIALFKDAPLWDAWPGWVLAVLLYDFCDYWLHRAGHESALFWAAHVVHHQSQCMNLSTALRQESAYAFLGWVFYLPLAVLGVPPDLYGIAGLVVLVYQFWIHTEHVGSLGWFDRVFSSPSNHRVHHAVNEQYIDRNYGAILVLWDRIFGTFKAEVEPCVYGTRTPLNSWNPLWAVAHEYRALLAKAARATGWRDKCRCVYKPPGWAPPGGHGVARDHAALHAALNAALLTVEPFDPPIDTSQRVAASSAFVATLLACCWFLWQSESLSDAVNVVAAFAVASGLWVTGALMAGRLQWLTGAVLCAVSVGATLLAAGHSF